MFFIMCEINFKQDFFLHIKNENVLQKFYDQNESFSDRNQNEERKKQFSTKIC